MWFLKLILGFFGFNDIVKEKVERQEAVNDGKLEEVSEAQAQEIKDVTRKNNIDNRIDNSSPADVDKMCADIDAADK